MNTMKRDQLTPEEWRLVSAYRLANRRRREAASDILHAGHTDEEMQPVYKLLDVDRDPGQIVNFRRPKV